MNHDMQARAPISVPERHYVLDAALSPPFDQKLEVAVFGMGCFWGAERLFWQLEGVHSTAVGYAAGQLEHPRYEEVCSGHTGHAEVVQVVFEPGRLAYTSLLRTFWEGHDPTQGMRQGNDIGTQYRSLILCAGPEQLDLAVASRGAYQVRLDAAGLGPITTQIQPTTSFYYAEAYHQQYLAKNPGGYCGLGGTGVACG